MFPTQKRRFPKGPQSLLVGKLRNKSFVQEINPKISQLTSTHTRFTNFSSETTCKPIYAN